MPTPKKFASKWSEAIEEHGYTSMPNLFMYQRKTLGVSVSQFFVLMCIESFRWDNRNPYPSMESLSKRANLSIRQVRNQIKALEKKGYVIRNYRKSSTSTYSLEGLIARLDTIAVSSLPPGRKLPPQEDKMRHMRGKELSAKEDPGKLTRNKPFIKNRLNSDIEGIGSIVARTVGSRLEPPMSNDFGYEAGGQNG